MELPTEKDFTEVKKKNKTSIKIQGQQYPLTLFTAEFTLLDGPDFTSPVSRVDFSLSDISSSAVEDVVSAIAPSRRSHKTASASLSG